MDNILHIYAQLTNHDEAFIIGDRAALIALRNAIHQALLNDEIDKGGHADFSTFASDGEAYSVMVGVLPYSEAANLTTPYTDPDAPRSGTLYPSMALDWASP